MRNADGWGLAFIIVGTAATMWMLPAQQPRNVHAMAQTPEIEVSRAPIDYKITIAAKRIPAECKTLGPDSASDLIAHCQSLAVHGTQVTMVPVNATIQLANQPDAEQAE